MRAVRPPRMGPDARKHFGCIATLERAGQRYAQHFTGGVDAVIEHCDTHGAVVICISTPDTILRDFDGTRADIVYARNARNGSGQPADRLQLPEEKMLSSRHRLDLWAGGR